jgi:hypothetical protein
VHRSVLQNKKYIKFSYANAVEVISMEEIARALEKSAHTIATYKTKDAYGDEVEYLAEFPGLTIDDLKTLSNTNAILEFMQGGKIPFTAIVDPHTGKAMLSMKGKPSVASLTAAIKKARATLEKEHGKGVDRKLWDELGVVEVKIDLALAEDKPAEAKKVLSALEKKLKRPREPVKERVDMLRNQIIEKLKEGLKKPDIPKKKKDEYQRLLEG